MLRWKVTFINPNETLIVLEVHASTFNGAIQAACDSLPDLNDTWEIESAEKF